MLAVSINNNVNRHLALIAAWHERVIKASRHCYFYIILIPRRLKLLSCVLMECHNQTWCCPRSKCVMNLWFWFDSSPNDGELPAIISTCVRVTMVPRVTGHVPRGSCHADIWWRHTELQIWYSYGDSQTRAASIKLLIVSCFNLSFGWTWQKMIKRKARKFNSD